MLLAYLGRQWPLYSSSLSCQGRQPEWGNCRTSTACHP